MTSRTLRVALVALTMAIVAVGCAGNRSASTGTGDGETTATTKVAATDQFGDLPTPCGSGDATGATDQGVTDTEITIGYGDDAGFPQSPGLEPPDVRRGEGDDRVVQRRRAASTAARSRATTTTPRSSTSTTP